MGVKIELLKHHADFSPEFINIRLLIGEVDTIHNKGALINRLQLVDRANEG